MIMRVLIGGGVALFFVFVVIIPLSESRIVGEGEIRENRQLSTSALPNKDATET